jgi:hypothetical protein
MQTSWLQALRASLREAGQHMTAREKLCKIFIYKSITIARFPGITLQGLSFSDFEFVRGSSQALV